MPQTLTTFKTFIDEINKDNSRNYKLSVLNKWKEDEIIRFYLHYVYNPYITTGLSTKKLSKPVAELVEWPSGLTINTTSDLLMYIKNHNTGKDEQIAIVNKFKKQLDADQSKLLDLIITKNLQLGVSVLSINKVMKKLIPQFEVMLADKYFDKPEVVDGKEFALTTKIDGGRIIAIKDHGVVEFFTRAGQKYEGLVDLEKEMLEKFPDEIALDGEITLLDSKGLDNKAQYKQTMMITRKDGEKHGIKMKVFDAMSANEFKHQESSLVYSTRRQLLNEMFKQPMQYFELLPILYQGTDVNMITTILDDQVKQGEEGVMINICNAYYQFKRSDALLKCKKFKDIDLLVTGLEEGSNQNKNKLGAFICDYGGNVVKVGGGISKELREVIWNNKEEYIGRTITVKYFEETTNKEGGKSLRFPTFVDFRTDKGPDEIKEKTEKSV